MSFPLSSKHVWLILRGADGGKNVTLTMRLAQVQPQLRL